MGFHLNVAFSWWDGANLLDFWILSLARGITRYPQRCHRFDKFSQKSKLMFYQNPFFFLLHDRVHRPHAHGWCTSHVASSLQQFSHSVRPHSSQVGKSVPLQFSWHRSHSIRWHTSPRLLHSRGHAGATNHTTVEKPLFPFYSRKISQNMTLNI